MKSAFAALLPPGVVRITEAAPAVPAGVVTVICVGLTTEIPVATTPPIVTLVTPVTFAPVMVMGIPPNMVPVEGEMLVTVGADGRNVKSVFAALVPPGVVTYTEVAPALPAFTVAVIVVGLTTSISVATSLPMFTEVAPVKFVPVIVTEVPPVSGPVEGETLMTVGGGGIR